MTSPIKAVVLDWAGTMIDHGSRAPVVALLRVFEDFGVPILEVEARTDMGRAKRDHVRGILATARVKDAWKAQHGADPDETAVLALHDALEPIMLEATSSCSTLIPGAAGLAQRLREVGIKIGSCTGYTRPMMAQILPLAEKQGYAPDVVVCAGETAEGRPSPLMLWKALVEMGTWPASSCIKVDDAPVGIAEGKGAGTWTVGVAASGNGIGLDHEELTALSPDDRTRRIAVAAGDLQSAGADYVIDSVAELWPVLETIAGRILSGEKPRQ